MALHWILLFIAVILVGLIAWHSSRFSAASLKKIFERRTNDDSDVVLGLEDDLENFITEDDDMTDQKTSDAIPKPERSRTFESNAELPAILTLHIKAPDGQAFAGAVLESRFRAAGLYFGAHNIFHYEVEKEGDYYPVFSLASAFEPGSFDLSTIHQYATQGLTLFMQTAELDSPRETFALMLKTAQTLAAELQGIACDDKWTPLSEASIARYYASLGE
jgi:cell division protein ZipA